MFEQAFKNIDDVLRKEAGCTTELDYTEQTSWLLFLKYLDGLEEDRATEAELEGKKYEYILSKKYRWETWAAPKGKDGKLDHHKAKGGPDLIKFVNDELFPYLQGFKQKAASPNTLEYKIGEIFGEIKNRISSGYNQREIIDHIDELRFRSQKEKHELSHLYEAKIRNMGNAGRNGGEYYTPRPLIRAMIQVIAPKIGDTIYDGACGSAGFLCEAFDYLKAHNKLTTKEMKTLQERTFFGREKKSLAYVIGIMNMILHGIDAPNIVHTNTLADHSDDIADKDKRDIVLANPPFGGHERREVQQNFRIRTGETAFLFLQHFIRVLKAGGNGAIVIKNTFLSNTDNASVSLRKALLEGCNLHTVLECPSGAFQGASVKTVVLFFEKGKPTRKTWYYQLDPGRTLGKTNPLDDDDLAEFVKLQKTFSDSPKSWTVTAKDIDRDTFDLSLKNPKGEERKQYRTPREILRELASLDAESAKAVGTVGIDARGASKKGWQTKRLGEFCTLTSGGTPSKNNPRYWVGEIPFVSARDLKHDRIESAALHISQEALEKSATKFAPVGSLLMLVRGMGLANGIQVGEVTAPVAYNQDIRAIQAPQEIALPRFLLLALRTAFAGPEAEHALSSAAHGTLKIDADALRQIVIPLPPIPEQRRIVAILDGAFENISVASANATKELAALDELKQSLLNQAFSGQL